LPFAHFWEITPVCDDPVLQRRSESWKDHFLPVIACVGTTHLFLLATLSGVSLLLRVTFFGQPLTNSF
jgi:hypothetical protein